jgi:hypothetical protein
MADDKPKKTKINLKDRLGRGAAAGGGGVAPAAMPIPMPGGGGMPPGGLDDSGRTSNVPASSPSQPAPGVSIPAPIPVARPSGGGIAPPPGMSPGIPLPPFGPQRRAAAEPKATAQAQTIKVEIGEEIHQERKAARRMTAIVAILVAAVAGGIGFVAGGSKSAGDRAKSAADGAGALEKDVKAANDKLKELDDKITAGAKDLSEKKFPKDLVEALKSTNVPFDATNLENKQVGSLPSKVLRPLLNFTSAVQEVNKQKDALKNILGVAEAPITKGWKEDKEPMVNFAVLVGGNGKYAELTTVKEPFKYAGNDWPKDLTVTKLENGKPVEKKASRWVKGDPDGTVFPVEPKSVAGFSNDALVGRLSKALFEVRELLEGKKDDQNGTAGLVKDGEELANSLHQASLNR